VGNGGSFWVLSSQGMKLTTHLQLVLILRMCGTIFPLFQYTSVACTGTTLAFPSTPSYLLIQCPTQIRRQKLERWVVTFLEDFMGSVECCVFYDPILRLKVDGAIPPLPIHLYITVLIKNHFPYTPLLSDFVATTLHQQIAHCHYR
jgi:hypothetical protein